MSCPGQKLTATHFAAVRAAFLCHVAKDVPALGGRGARSTLAAAAFVPSAGELAVKRRA